MLELLLSLPTIDIPAPAAPPGSEAILTIVSWIGWILIIGGIVGVIRVAFVMILSQRNHQGGSEAIPALGWVAGGLILGGSAAQIVTLFLG